MMFFHNNHKYLLRCYLGEKELCPIEFDRLVDEVQSFDAKFIPYYWQKKAWKELAKYPHNYMLLTLFDRSLMIGLVLWYLPPSDDLAHLLKIGLIPEFRSLGLGSRFLGSSIQKLKKIQRSRYFLEVEKANFPATAFYARQGFKELHVRKKFYSDGKSAVIMAKNG